MTANSPLESPLREGPAGDLTSGTKERVPSKHTLAQLPIKPQEKKFVERKGPFERRERALSEGDRRWTEKGEKVYTTQQQQKRIRKRRKEEEEEALGGGEEGGGRVLPFPLPFLYFRKEEKEERKAEELLLASRPRLLSPCGSGKKVFSVLLSSPLIE